MTLLSHPDALTAILADCPRLADEPVPLTRSLGRVLASDCTAQRNLPPFDNSAMDGFAVRTAELPGTLPIAGTIAAGDGVERELPPGSVMRIMTGAPVPRGADAIVMKENVVDHGDHADFVQPGEAGRHIRLAGEDMSVGERFLRAGVRLHPGEVGALAAQSFATIPCARRPRVAVLTTGSELVDVHTTPGPHQIVNSNMYALSAQIEEAGGEATAIGTVADDLTSTSGAIAQGLDYDVLITCGGVSVGNFDFVKAALDANAVETRFWKVAIKPGKPVVFGRAPSGTLVFGLPGNPISSMVTFELFVRPALLTMQGCRDATRRTLRAKLRQQYRKRGDRTHFVRATLETEAGELWANIKAAQGSGMLSSMIGVDALVVVDGDVDSIDAGSTADILLLR